MKLILNLKVVSFGKESWISFTFFNKNLIMHTKISKLIKNKRVMNKELYLLLICTLFSTIGLFAQDSLRVDSRYETKSAGFGIGLEYGGLGLNLVLNLTENIGITGGAGLTPIGAGYNGGLKLRFHPEIGGSTPYIQALYGYNAMIYIKNRDKLSKFFYGPSIGGRLDFPIGKGNTCLSIGVYYPI